MKGTGRTEKQAYDNASETLVEVSEYEWSLTEEDVHSRLQEALDEHRSASRKRRSPPFEAGQIKLSP